MNVKENILGNIDNLSKLRRLVVESNKWTFLWSNVKL